MRHHQLPQRHPTLLQHPRTLRIHRIVQVVHDLFDARLDDLDRAPEAGAAVGLCERGEPEGRKDGEGGTYVLQ